MPPAAGPNSVGEEVSVSVIRRMEGLNSKNASTRRNIVAAIEGHHVGTSLGTWHFAHIAEHLDVQKRTRGLGLGRQSSNQNEVTKKPDGVVPSGQSTGRGLQLKSAGVNPPKHVAPGQARSLSVIARHDGYFAEIAAR
jgi:hypothetical protein